MQYILSKHAKEQLERRGIDASQIDTIINHPDSKEPNLVVTAYKTSKLSKYENKV